MTENEAKAFLKIEKQCINRNCDRNCAKCDIVQKVEDLNSAYDTAIKALEEIQQYRAIGTIEELQKAEKEENILKFYYCDSEDSYLVGLRIENCYYAHYIDGIWVFDMSRYLPWGKHVVDDTTAWKEYTYPSEPREISFSEWLNGFIKKECGGTPEECRAAMKKQNVNEELESHDEKHSLECCISLMQEIVNEFAEWYRWQHGEDAIKELDAEERFCFRKSYFCIVQELFLLCTRHSGGTSTRAKCEQLGVDSAEEIEFDWRDEE